MPIIRLNSSESLIYNSEYQVLICSSCQYAIQTSALQSHLLRHKIFRDDRKRTLKAIDEFNLLEPESVTQSDPASPAIAGLSVTNGLRCTFVGCGHLCASDKRMRKHWSDVHDSSKLGGNRYAEAAKLQTFFRGNKLRYFEVDRHVLVDDCVAKNLRRELSASKDMAPSTRGIEVEAESLEMLSLQSRTDWLEPPKAVSNQQHTNPAAMVLDMTMLKYFHHFTSKTAATLFDTLLMARMPPSWTDRAIRVALDIPEPWLMCGLLAIATGHEGAELCEAAKRRAHGEHFEQFSTAFTNSRHSWKDSWPSEECAFISCAAGRIKWVLDCIAWQFNPSVNPHFDTGTVNRTRVFEIFANVKTVAEELMPSDYVQKAQQRDDDDDAMQKQAQQALDLTPFVARNNRLASVFVVLRSLPSRMTVVLGRPNNIKDPRSVLAAFRSLWECSVQNCGGTAMAYSWLMMAAWSTKISKHFTTLMKEEDPAALLVTAYWSLIMEELTQESRCWWLRPVFQALHASILCSLGQCGHLESLIEDLLSCGSAHVPQKRPIS